MQALQEAHRTELFAVVGILCAELDTCTAFITIVIMIIYNDPDLVLM